MACSLRYGLGPSTEDRVFPALRIHSKTPFPHRKLFLTRGNLYCYTSPYIEMYGGLMEFILAITRALSDENRLRALLALKGRELCVCQLIELLQLAPSTVSKHMSVLKQARLVKGHKRGRWMYYQQAGSDASTEVQHVLEWLHTYLPRSPRIKQDQNQVKMIAKLDRNELCRRQTCR